MALERWNLVGGGVARRVKVSSKGRERCIASASSSCEESKVDGKNNFDMGKRYSAVVQ